MIISYFDDLPEVKIYKELSMSVPLILTILAGQPRLLARFSAFSGKNPRTATGVFARICGGDHVAHLINGMLPAALAAEGMSPVLGYGMFSSVCLAILAWTACCHMRIRRFNAKIGAAVAKIDQAHSHSVTLGISLHNFPEGIATFVTAAATWSWDLASHWPSRCTISLRSGGCRPGLCSNGF